MWWVHESGAFYADGYKGQKVLVSPEHELVVVVNVFSGTRFLRRLSDKELEELGPFLDPVIGSEFRHLVDLILAAAPELKQ